MLAHHRPYWQRKLESFTTSMFVHTSQQGSSKTIRVPSVEQQAKDPSMLDTRYRELYSMRLIVRNRGHTFTSCYLEARRDGRGVWLKIQNRGLISRFTALTLKDLPGLC